MKRLLILLSIAFVALMSMCFTSCDEDQMIAMNIQGTWRGTISTNYYKSWWSLDQGGDYYTIFHFSGDLGSRHGHGYEIDFTRNNQSASRSRFEYWVKGSEVEITFENGRRFYIYGITTDNIIRLINSQPQEEHRSILFNHTMGNSVLAGSHTIVEYLYQ